MLPTDCQKKHSLSQCFPPGHTITSSVFSSHPYISG
jgi:hypothetical protein